MKNEIFFTLTLTLLFSFAFTVSAYNFGNVTLKNGSRGEAVMELQRFLNENLNLGLIIDGKLGSKTIAVIKKWQTDNELKPDGFVGLKTKEKMNSVIIEKQIILNEGLKKAFSRYKDGEINQCTQDGKIYYTGGINAYDGGSSTLDINGKVVGGCQGFTGKCEGIMPTNCERIYAVYPNIWGFPAVNKYNLK